MYYFSAYNIPDSILAVRATEVNQTMFLPLMS